MGSCNVTSNLVSNSTQIEIAAVATKGHLYIFISVYSLIFLVGSIGNSLTIILFGFTQRKNESGAKLVIVLALTDLVSSILVPMYWIYFYYCELLLTTGKPPLSFPFSNLGCYMTMGCLEIFTRASSILLVAISLQRLR